MCWWRRLLLYSKYIALATCRSEHIGDSIEDGWTKPRRHSCKGESFLSQVPNNIGSQWANSQPISFSRVPQFKVLYYHSWHLECPPNAVWSQAWYSWEEPSRRSLGHRGNPLKGIVGNLVSPSSSLCLGHEVRGFSQTHAPPMMWPHQSPKQWGPTGDHGQEPLTLRTPRKWFLLINWLSGVFCNRQKANMWSFQNTEFQSLKQRTLEIITMYLLWPLEQRFSSDLTDSLIIMYLYTNFSTTWNQITLFTC